MRFWLFGRREWAVSFSLGLCTVLIGCGGVAVDDALGNEGSGSTGNGTNVSSSRGGVGADSQQSEFQRQLGSVSDGGCQAGWESIGLNNMIQRKQWSAPELAVDCDAGTQILTTETIQNGFPLVLTFVFLEGRLQSATNTTFLGGDLELESELTVDKIRFEDLRRGRRRIEFEGSILPPRGEPIDARGVGDACQQVVSC